MKKLLLLNIAALLLVACQLKGNNNSSAEETVPAVAETPAEGTEIGDKYIDIKLSGIYGVPISVSEYVAKNKYTLVDFWASWCPPCRAEMPVIVKAYTDYHGKGLEVVGVSLDKDQDAWLEAIEQLKMPWPQMSDLKGWESEGARLYNVRSIPANVLIDQQGKIIAKNLRGEDLLLKLEELMK